MSTRNDHAEWRHPGPTDWPMALRRGLTHSFFIEILAICTVIILGYIALFIPPEQAANLPVVPDEGQYAISASNLFTKGTYSITLNHQDYPTLYPYGFPLLLLPAFYLWGPFVGTVAYMNFLLNLGVVILTYMLGRMVGGWYVGCIAALFLLGNHLFLTFSHLIITQGAVACFFVLATILLLKVQDTSSTAFPLGPLSGLGVIAGWLSSLHASWVCLDTALMVTLYLIYRKSRQKLIGALLIVGGITFAFITAQMTYNKETFGDFLQNGYEFWNEIPTTQFFSLRWLLSFHVNLLYEALAFMSLTRLRWFFNSNNLTYYFSGVLGLHDNSVLYSPAAAVLIGLGSYYLLKNQYDGRGRLLASLAAASVGSLLILFVPYYYKDTRFLIPILPLLGVIASIGVMNMFKRHCQWSGGRVRATAALVLGLLFFVDLFHTYSSTGIQYRQVELARQNGRIRMARYACAQIYNSLTEENAVIVSALDINYISHFVLTGTERRYLPLVRNIMYVSRDPQLPNKNWRPLGLPVAVESPDTISSLLHAGVPVYADDLEEINFNEEYLALRSSFKWQAVGSCASFHIYRLHNNKSG